MLIAGIAGSKHPTLKRGDAIPMAPKEKALHAAMRGWSALAPEGHDFVCQNTSIKEFTDVAGASGQYQATVVVDYRTIRHSDGRLFAPKRTTVSVLFKEIKDSLGQDDIEVISINQL